MTLRSKRAAELEPGDLVLLSKPHGRGVVVSNQSSERTPISLHARGIPATALIIVFDVTDGENAGKRMSDFVHPESKVQII